MRRLEGNNSESPRCDVSHHRTFGFVGITYFDFPGCLGRSRCCAGMEMNELPKISKTTH